MYKMPQNDKKSLDFSAEHELRSNGALKERVVNTHYSLHFLSVEKYHPDWEFKFQGYLKGRPWRGLCHVVSGSCKFISSIGSDSVVYTVNAGETVYLPEALSYRTEWMGDSIEYYTLNFGLSGATIVYEKSGLSIVHSDIDEHCRTPVMVELDNADRLFEDMYNDYSSGDSRRNLLAISTFYRLWSDVSKQLDRLNGACPRKTSDDLAPALTAIERNPAARLSVAELAALCHMSEPQFYRRFKAVTDMTPVAYRNEYLCRIAHRLIIDGRRSVIEVSELLGFSSVNYFRRIYRAYQREKGFK